MQRVNFVTLAPMPALEKSVAGVDRAAATAARALRLHAHYRGKIGTISKVPFAGADELAIWYTPGVAEPCRAIVADAEASFAYTNRANVIAIVSDGSRVLGLGDIGPEAGLPVMEGKALLFKLFGGVDAVPLCIRAREAEDIVRAVELIEPSFGAINLETSPSRNASPCSTRRARMPQSRCGTTTSRARPRLRLPLCSRRLR